LNEKIFQCLRWNSNAGHPDIVRAPNGGGGGGGSNNNNNNNNNKFIIAAWFCVCFVNLFNDVFSVT